MQRRRYAVAPQKQCTHPIAHMKSAVVSVQRQERKFHEPYRILPSLPQNPRTEKQTEHIE